MKNKRMTVYDDYQKEILVSLNLRFLRNILSNYNFTLLLYFSKTEIFQLIGMPIKYSVIDFQFKIRQFQL